MILPLLKWPAASFLAFATRGVVAYGCSFLAVIEPGYPGGRMCVHGAPEYGPATAA